MKIDLKQPSTKKGLALIGAGIALATGHPELLTASVTPEGVQMGGLIGVAAPILLGLWETIRDESSWLKEVQNKYSNITASLDKRVLELEKKTSI